MNASYLEAVFRQIQSQAQAIVEQCGTVIEGLNTPPLPPAPVDVPPPAVTPPLAPAGDDLGASVAPPVTANDLTIDTDADNFKPLNAAVLSAGGLNVHTMPAISAPIKRAVPSGTPLVVTDTGITADSFHWYQIVQPDADRGDYVAGQFLSFE